MNSFTYHSDPVRIVFGARRHCGAARGSRPFHKMSRLLVLCSKSRADFARRVTAPIADRCVGFCDTAGPDHAARSLRSHRRRHQAAQCRRLHCGRRRLADRARQGRGGDDQNSLYRRRHHLFRLGDGGALVYRRCRQSRLRRRPGSVAGDRDLRSRTHARPAAARVGGKRHECHGACGREPLRHRHQPRRPDHGRGSGPPARREPAARGAKSARSRRRAPTRSTAPGWRRISAPRSVSNTPSRNACGNGSISIMPIPTPSRRLMRSASTPPRRPRPWRASSARSASTTRRAGFTISMSASGCRPGFKDLGMREDDIGKAVEVVAAVKITHPRPVDQGGPRQRHHPSLCRRAAAILEWRTNARRHDMTAQPPAPE